MADTKPEPQGPQPDKSSEPYSPYEKGKRMAMEPVVYPDGHVALSAEDIKERDAK